MDTARADALAAHERLRTHGWIAARAETFRHLPPPAADTWLQGPADGATPGCDAPPLAGAGWTLHPVGHAPQGSVQARWLDALDPAQRAELFAGLPQPGDGDAAPFAWAHRALCRQGLRLRVQATPGKAGPDQGTVWLQLRHQPRAQAEAPLLVLDIDPGVHCVLIETHERETAQCGQAVAQNLHTHIHLGAGATLRHLRIAAPGAGDQIAHHVHARIDTHAHYEQALVATEGAYHLQRTLLDLQGHHATAHASGLLLAAGQALEQQVHTAHHAAHTTSQVETLALASGAARVVANAHTRIAPGADEAAVRQRLTGIPLAGRPRLVMRPHLEIQHDQVQAAHGATWGALPEDALFYARQRGLDDASARALVVEGMAHALLERCIDHPELLATWLSDGWLTQAIARHLATAQETHHE
ncbi:SufD family Fe-S cluster assembly protein [Simplicispira lacusdiani]|uniref:SufD family Fe-S cluster assembly protein n=1 Tax=Simplicispira lacusdiani TaxID=2213010 RepID=UPI000E7400C8|nr:SufD family Fe-S cluster assembly protein [Simplicispira lacusdiani]